MARFCRRLAQSARRRFFTEEEPELQAELWQGLFRKTYLVPYRASWESLAPGEAQLLRDHIEVVPEGSAA